MLQEALLKLQLLQLQLKSPAKINLFCLYTNFVTMLSLQTRKIKPLLNVPVICHATLLKADPYAPGNFTMSAIVEICLRLLVSWALVSCSSLCRSFFSQFLLIAVTGRLREIKFWRHPLSKHIIQRPDEKHSYIARNYCPSFTPASSYCKCQNNHEYNSYLCR